MSGDDDTGGQAQNIAGSRKARRLWAAATLTVAVAGAAAVVTAIALAGSSQSAPPAIAVGVGDIVKVAGSPIGCAVRLQDGERALDCRRIGPLTGTYGSILTAHRLLVVRFVSRTAATVVFSARHGQSRARTCG